MPTLFKRPNGKWYIAWWHEGIQHRKSLRTSDEGIAREAFSDFDYNFRHGLLGLPGRRRIPLLGELFDEYLQFMKNHREPRTYKHAELYVRLFLRPAFGNIRADHLTNKNIEDFISKMRNWTDKKGISMPYHPETINKRLKCLGAVYRRAIRNGVIDKAPVYIQLLRAPRPLPKYVTPDQFATWLQHITKPINRYRAILELCTGIPDSELAKLTWNKNYVEELGIIKYKRGKTKEEIVIKLNAWASEVIEKLKSARKGPYLFQGTLEARKAYEIASTNSGIKVTPHMLRHSFATWALSEGEPLSKISAILGHQDQRTTQIYARVMPTFLLQTTSAIDRLRPPSTREITQPGLNHAQQKSKKKPVKQ